MERKQIVEVIHLEEKGHGLRKGLGAPGKDLDRGSKRLAEKGDTVERFGTSTRRRHLEGELEDVPDEKHEQGVGGEVLGHHAAALEHHHLDAHQEETKAGEARG